MSWGTHPDTLMLAAAMGEADRKVAHRESFEWRNALADAYDNLFEPVGKFFDENPLSRKKYTEYLRNPHTKWLSYPIVKTDAA